MKLWYKILWITTAIVPFAVIALAWQYAESSFFLWLCSQKGFNPPLHRGRRGRREKIFSKVFSIFPDHK